MKTFHLTLVLSITCSIHLFAQSYTSYRLGSDNSIDTSGTLSLTLMGGSSEQDTAMAWFLEQANGGDVLVIRTSGSDGYNDYLYSELGVEINSVETIVWHNKEASSDSYVLSRIQEAEAIWIAGGDQAVYVNYWQQSEVNAIVSAKLQEKTLAIGGISAGAAILGNYYFTAENGTITSDEALQDPFDERITLDTTAFFDVPIGGPFEGIKFFTDTHIDNPDRRGRMAVFSLMLSNQYDEVIYGIGLEEYTAMTITEQGEMTFFGDYPNEEDQVKIIGPWCIHYNGVFATEISEGPLTLRYRELASPVISLNGTPDGNDFSINKFILFSESIEEEEWTEFQSLDGVFEEVPILGIIGYCIANTDDIVPQLYELSPNPTDGELTISSLNDVLIENIIIYNSIGRPVLKQNIFDTSIDVNHLVPGHYLLQVNGKYQVSFIKQ